MIFIKIKKLKNCLYKQLFINIKIPRQIYLIFTPTSKNYPSRVCIKIYFSNISEISCKLKY